MIIKMQQGRKVDSLFICVDRMLSMLDAWKNAILSQVFEQAIPSWLEKTKIKKKSNKSLQRQNNLTPYLPLTPPPKKKQALAFFALRLCCKQILP